MSKSKQIKVAIMTRPEFDARFLRCASLYVHFYTDVPLPQRLPTDQADKPSTPDTVYETLCTYLALPTNLADLVASEGFSETVDM